MWLSVADRPTGTQAATRAGHIDATAVVEAGVILNEEGGPIDIAAHTRICSGAILTGPIQIGADCLVGPQAVIRGPCVIGSDVRIGHSTEISRATITDGTRIGPRCSLRGR